MALSTSPPQSVLCTTRYAFPFSLLWFLSILFCCLRHIYQLIIKSGGNSQKENVFEMQKLVHWVLIFIPQG